MKQEQFKEFKIVELLIYSLFKLLPHEMPEAFVAEAFVKFQEKNEIEVDFKTVLDKALYEWKYNEMIGQNLSVLDLKANIAIGNYELHKQQKLKRKQEHIQRQNQKVNKIECNIF
eukprot:403343603